ncbi:MAG TPA: ATP-binding protein, partial [Candidatus Nanopelagicales bacterium]|nr:ATP-binding protein [Candidatus Nanopelagicales bacterium]
MKIESLRYEEGRTGWTLEEAHFNGFNLLVGPSGAGKTKIISCLERICRVATKRIHPRDPLDGERWTVRFSHSGELYTWELRSAILQGQGSEDLLVDALARRSQIEFERLTRNERDVVVERGPDRMVFEGRDAPLLTATESVVALLSDPLVSAIQSAFHLLVFSQATIPGMIRLMIDSWQSVTERISRSRSKYTTFDELVAAADLPIHTKAYLLQEIAPDRFDEIKSRFCEMFSSVEDLRIGLLSESEIAQQFGRSAEGILSFIKERGTATWIPETAMSSGMQRTLLHLLEVSLAPPGSVFIIDEFENSLGVNCMPSLTEFILEHAPQHQFIITSHHPYIINQIPIDRWKLVQRRASRVRVVPPATSLRSRAPPTSTP